MGNIISNIPLYVFWKDRDGRYLGCNQKFASMAGVGKGDNIVGKTDHDLTWRREAVETIGYYDRRVMKTKDPLLDIEEPHLHADGKEATLLTSRVPLEDESGNVIGVLGICADITERKRAERERELLRSAIEQGAEAIVITDSEGAIQYVNPAYERITGYARAEAVGQNLRFLKDGEHDNAFHQKVWDTITRSATWSGRFVNKRKDGTLYTEELTISPVHDALGTTINFVVVKRDITQEITLENQLRQAQKLEVVGTLAAGVAHEINNPNALVLLNSRELVKIFTDIAPILDLHYQLNGEFSLGGLDFSEIRDDLPRLLNHIVESAQRIKMIVSDLKAFASVDERPGFERVDLNQVVNSALPFVESLINDSTERFAISYSPAPLPVKGISKRFEQVVINLLQNACQSLTDKSAKISLSLFHDEESQCQVLKIKDEGCGISKENLARIKEPFFTTRRNDGGTGLGLSVSMRIVEKGLGKLEFSSAPGVGTTATLSFPVCHTEFPE